MQKRNLLYAALILAITVALSSCFHDHDLHIRVNDDDDVYRMRAYFDEDLTADVQRVVNKHLKQHHSASFAHVYTDGDVRLDDGTSFYLKIVPGRLKIKIDKLENHEEGCEDLRQMCDEIKEVLANSENNE